jgi:beta-glucosidase
MRRGIGQRRAWAGVLLAALAAIVFAATALAAPGRPNHGGSDHPPGGGYPNASAEARAAALLSRMTLAEKVGQTTQINVTKLQGDPGNDWDRGELNEQQLQLVLADHLAGSILSGGGASPAVNSPRAWAEMTNAIQRYAIEHSRLHIPIIYGIDAVHGHNNVLGATMFPHQIGLGATFDPDLVGRLGESTARAVRATGIHWNFAPVVDTARDLRWGRYYEPFGEDPLLTGTLAAADIRGMQGRDLSRPDAVAATAKHFAGYSAPDSGHDRTDATISPSQLQDVHLPPFAQAIDAGAATVMINSGSVNGEPVHASHHLLTDVLRGQLGFQGVAVSDWQDVEYLVTKYHVAANYQEAVALAFNAGMDMAMVPLDVVGYTAALAANVRSGAVSQARLNEAVSRILTLKFRLGLFERPYVDPGRAERVLADPEDHRLAREAASESLVLLENHDRTLPLSPWRTRRVLVTGPSSDSAANQLGGWSIGWQGLTVPGEIPEVTTLKEGMEQAAGSTEISWSAGVPDGAAAADPAAVTAARQEAVAAAQHADAVVVAVGEGPYAEGEGDTDTAALPDSHAQLVDALEQTGKPVIVVVIAGRPLIMNQQLDAADAALMAFLPGTEGGAAIADVLFGRQSPTGRLPVSWPKSIAQAPMAYDHPASEPYDPRYPFGHGLGYQPLEVRDVRMPDQVRPDERVRVDVSLGGGEGTLLAFVERTDGAATARARQLVAFERVDRGRWASLTWSVSQLAATQPSGERVVVPGTYRLVVGDRSQTFTVGQG